MNLYVFCKTYRAVAFENTLRTVDGTLMAPCYFPIPILVSLSKTHHLSNSRRRYNQILFGTYCLAFFQARNFCFHHHYPPGIENSSILIVHLRHKPQLPNAFYFVETGCGFCDGGVFHRPFHQMHNYDMS